MRSFHHGDDAGDRGFVSHLLGQNNDAAALEHDSGKHLVARGFIRYDGYDFTTLFFC
jgi:hypothetical protein